jgi:hypothetical protein
LSFIDPLVPSPFSRDGPEHRVQHPSGPVFGGREEVGVDPKGETRVGVSEMLGHRLHGLAGVDEHRRVEVPERVHAVGATGFDASGDKCGPPALLK